MSGFVGEFISKEWAMRNIMRFSDDDIKDIEKEISGEVSSGEIEDKTPQSKEEPPQKEEPPKKDDDKSDDEGDK